MTYGQRAGVYNVALVTLVASCALIAYSQARIVGVLIKLDARLSRVEDETQNMLGEILEEVQSGRVRE